MKTTFRFFVGWILGAVILALTAFCSNAQAPAANVRPIVTSAQAEFFENKVRPVLALRCYGCHAKGQKSGGLPLDQRAGLLRGGEHGPAIVPGDAEHSLLLKTLQYTDSIKMPPTGKLSQPEIAALTEWISTGAVWPDTPEKTVTARAGLVKPHWAFQPVRKPALPVVKNKSWAQSPIDRFILAKLETKGLTPAPPADRRTLIRRATFDLIGLPPTPEETDAFLKDKSPAAFAHVVDRLLASPRYGERWGRHWLDVARYADTKGYTFTEESKFGNAYAYRDYVIRAFNEDLPYNQFVIQQLAADCLPLGEERRSLAALGFLTLGRRFLNDKVLIADDRIDTTCRGMMGLTVACARCHDHKFDPIPAKDYYALYGVFASSKEKDLVISPKAISEPYQQYEQKRDATEERGKFLLQTQVAALRKQAEDPNGKLPEEVKKTLQQFRVEAFPNGEQMKQLAPHFAPEARKELQGLDETLNALKKAVPSTPEFAEGLEEEKQPVDPHIFLRGNPNRPGEATTRHFLTVLSTSEPKPFTQGSGRLELARAIASKDNPLTARVLVNRVWQAHFGAGLVRTPGDFGTRGEPPTHPELLDWLAANFVADGSGTANPYACGWSIKKLHRILLLSSVYQMRSEGTAYADKIDPENRLLSHQNLQRLDLEALRDSLLMVSGALDLQMGGPSVDITGTSFSNRRTVYSFVERQNLPGLFRTFDFASPDTTTAQRHQTTVPQQALFMMNSPFVIAQAKQLAARPEIAALPDDAARIEFLYRRLFLRHPTPVEKNWGVTFLQSATQTAPAELTPFQRYVQTLLMTNEFTFVD